MIEIASEHHLRCPHGLDFFDDDTIIVANREGDTSIFALPSEWIGGNCYELNPLAVIRSEDLMHSPGSVSLTKKFNDTYEAVICHNYCHNVTRHVIELGNSCTVKSSDVLLRKWLDTPDGVSVSREMRWIAISNHGMQNVLIYRNTSDLNGMSDPVGMLRCSYFPHGLRFTADDRFIFVADAGSPFVHVYGQDGSSWRGVRNPLISIRVLNVDDFLRGRHNHLEGGPKGIDINNSMDIFVTTCEYQPLIFFDLASISQNYLNGHENTIERPADRNLSAALYGPRDGYCHDQRALEIKYELHLLSRLKHAEVRALELEQRLNEDDKHSS